MKRRQWDTTLYKLAEPQAGYFTAAQALDAGVLQVRLAQLHQRGDIERVTRGVYRLARYPISPLGQYMEAALWPQVRRPDAYGVISHESALAIYGLSDVSPAKVHLTLPTGLRIRRAAPKHLILHYADLNSSDEQRVEGVPVTTPARAIRDAHASHLGPALIRQAIADGRRTGHLTLSEADTLERELLGDQAPAAERSRAIPRDCRVTASRRQPTGPPPSAGVLAKYVQAYAREAGLSEGRVRGWISYMVMAGALERSAASGQPRFTVKGGIALELRLRNRARATKDIDVVLQHVDADLARTLEGAVSGEAYQGFTFRRKGEPLRLDNGAVNLELAVSYLGGAWTTIAVDIARAEPGEAEIEWLPAIPLTDAFGITGPIDLPCLPLRFHIAQKLHGMTLPPRAGKRNERFRDLVDLLLMEELVVDYQGLREACEAVFRSRDTHVWPPALALPPHWIGPFVRLAGDLDLPVADGETGMRRVRAFVERIVNA